MELDKPIYIASMDEAEDQKEVLDKFTTARNVHKKEYNQFNGRSLETCIDDWTKRWNGWIPSESILDENLKSRVFLNFTRNAIINYLAKVALTPPSAKIRAVNKKTGIGDIKFAQFLEDIKNYSERNENYPKKFLAFAIELVVKGTGIMYEGYLRQEQETKIPEGFDPLTGKIKLKKGKRILFDDCYAKIVPVEDFYIPNPYEADVQKQPFVIWREVTTESEAKAEYGHYANFEYVKPGGYAVGAEPNTFYRSGINIDLGKDQVEILRYYKRLENKHIILINGIVIYSGPIPFKDGRYPFAKAVFEPYGNDFFWGSGYPQKIMGEQDAQNTYINLMLDKSYGSMLPFGLTSDLDDLVEDETLQPNRVRKVGDISKWSFQTLPGVTNGEQQVFQTLVNLARENSTEGGANLYSPKGGKLQVRQVLLKQQEMMQKIGFSVSFMEDFEQERAQLRINHALQFYAIPRMEKITGKNGKEIEQMIFRDVKLDNVDLGGKTGNRVIKLVGDTMTEDDRAKLQDQLSVTEMQGEEMGVPTEALAVHVDTFQDYNYSVQVEKYSSYQKNQILDQASKQEYANWRLSLLQIAPCNVQELIAWVDEAYDIDPERFRAQQMPQQPQMPGQQPQSQQGQTGQNPAQQMAPSNIPPLQQIMQ